VHVSCTLPQVQTTNSHRMNSATTESSCYPNFSPDVDRFVPYFFVSLFIFVVFQASAVVGIPSRFSKGDDRWGFIFNRSIIRSSSLSPYRKQTGGMEAYRQELRFIITHLECRCSHWWSTYASLSPDFFSFHCLLVAELDNICMYRYLRVETLINWKAIWS
jgi:hypothetical protein